MPPSSTPDDPFLPLIRQRMEGLPVEAHDPAEGLPLQVVGFGPEEVREALEAMLETQVTMGRRVRAFEEAWAAWCGRRHAVMVNSGSSANLLAWTCLVAGGRLQPGDEVLVPAVGWSTTLFPVLQAGLRAVLVDVHPETLCMDPDLARAACTPRTRAVFPVHLLGCPADLDALEALDLLLVEDACGAHGARWGGRRIGSFGCMSTFSFFFSHHLTTIEGGILCTDDDALADCARSLRAHGWIRERSDAAALAARHSETDPRFLFVTPGYNLRPTEIAGAFGLHQLPRLDAWVARRRANHLDWCRRVRDAGLPIHVVPEPEGALHSAFAFPFLLPEGGPPRARATAFLESRRIATRPISGSNLARQPATRGMAGLHIPHPLPVADAVHDRGVFVGQSHAFGPAHGDLLVQTLTELFNG